MTTWLRYLSIGKRIYVLLARRFPQLGAVPVEDIVSVVEEVLTTSATVSQAEVITEPAPQRVLGLPLTPHRRLVLKGKPAKS